LRYLEAVLECINLFDNFDILGHIDLIRRYGCYDDKTLKLDDFKDRVDAILKALVEKGKGFGGKYLRLSIQFRFANAGL